MNTFHYPALKRPVSVRALQCNSVGAVIDIGSDSVKLLVGQVNGAGFERICSIGESIKVGQGAFQTRRLQPDVIERVASIVAEFVGSARRFSPSIFRILATSAVREAVNRGELVRAVEAKAQRRVEILSGEEEAQLLFEGVRREPGLAGVPLMVVDVGGGSTQIIISERSGGALYYSFPFGSLRLLESLGLSAVLSKSGLKRCRASAASFVQHRVISAIGQTRFEGAPFNAMRLVGTGKKLRALASAGKLFKELPQTNGAVSLTSKGLTSIIDGLWGMNRRDRAAILSISEADADVVLTAAITLEAVLKRFDFDVLHASSGNLRQGAILKAFAERREAVLRRHD